MRVLFSSFTVICFFLHVEVWLASLYKKDIFVYVIEQIAHNLDDEFHNLLDITHASYNYGTFRTTAYGVLCEFIDLKECTV